MAARKWLTNSGQLDSAGEVRRALRTELHLVLMPLARAHLGAAGEGAARGESPLGDVAAFILLSHCALNSFLWSIWHDREDARPHKVEKEMVGRAKKSAKPRASPFGHLLTKVRKMIGLPKENGGRRSIRIYDLLTAVGRGADGRQTVVSRDLAEIKDYIHVRNTLLQHSLQQFSDSGAQTPVRAKLTVAYGEQVSKHLENAIRAISAKYERDVSWLDQR